MILLAFVSVCLAGTAIVLFGHSARTRHYEYADRLALMPIDDDESPVPDGDAAETGINPQRMES